MCLIVNHVAFQDLFVVPFFRCHVRALSYLDYFSFRTLCVREGEEKFGLAYEMRMPYVARRHSKGKPSGAGGPEPPVALGPHEPECKE